MLTTSAASAPVMLHSSGLEVLVARAACALVEVELEGGIARGDALHRFDRGAGERGASEVGVDDHASRVDDAHERGIERAAARDQQVDGLLGERAAGAADLIALRLQHVACQVGDGVAAVRGGERGDTAVGEQGVDRGQRAVGVGHRNLASPRL